MNNIPFIFCAFANDKARYLDQLPQEANDIAALFRDKAHLCQIEVLSNTRPNDLHDVIVKRRNDIHIVHYGGHTNGRESLLVNDTHARQYFDNEAFADLLKDLPQLKLVFINGCSSSAMVQYLYDAGIAAVIGTTTHINDLIAFQLSVAFYKGIAQQLTILEAWNKATALIRGQYKTDNRFRDLDFGENDIDADSPHAAWFIKLREGAGDWKLAEIEKEEIVSVKYNTIHNTGDNAIILQDVQNSHINIHAAKEKPKYFEKGYRILHNTSETPLLHKVIAREQDLDKVRKMLVANQQCVVVNGIGGIGKTTLSRYYIERYAHEYAHIIWLYENKDAYDIFFSDTELLINLGIKEQVFEHNNKGEKQQAINLVMQTLNQLQKPILLAVDNVQDLVNFQYITQTLDKNKYHLLITSRQKKGKFPLYELGSLSEEEAKDLFCLFYYFNEEVEEEEILATKENPNLARILKKASYHTLTVEVLAGILKSSEMLTLETLADELEQGVISQQLKQEIDTHYTEKEATIYETILLAFNISGISEKKKSFDLLAEWAVLPSFYIPQATLFTLIGVNEENKYEIDNSLKTLIENAWVQKNTKGGRSYACHAVIQEAVRLQLGATENNILDISKSSRLGKFEYKPLIKKLYWLLHYKAKEIPLEKVNWLPYATSILTYITAETKELATLFNNTASIYQVIGDLPKSLEYRLKNLVICEKILSPNDPNLATSYNNIGLTYQAMGDFSKSLEYGLKSMKIREKIFSTNHPDLATSYKNIASIYQAIGNFSKSLEYGLKDIAICEKNLSSEHPNLAISYNNIADTYQTIGDLPKSLEYGLKSMLISQKVLPSKHPNIASLYNNISFTYKAIGDFSKSLEYGLKSMAIREEIFSPEHPDLATSYKNIAGIYQAIGDFFKSLEYGLKDIAICEKNLSPNHPDLATSYNNIAEIYRAIGDLPKSLEYGLKSMLIKEKIFSSDHSGLATSYNNIALTYQAMGDLSKSLEYGLKAVAIFEKKLSPDHPDLATSYNNIAETHKTMGDFSKSLEYGLKTVLIFEKTLSSDHPSLAASYNNIAGTYRAMGDLPKSLEYGLRSMGIMEKKFSSEHFSLAAFYNNLALTYQAMGDLPKSLEYGLRSMVIKEKKLSPKHPDLAVSYNNLAVTYYYLQDYIQSLAYFQKAILIWRKSLSKGHSDIKKAIDSMAVVLEAAIDAGKIEEVREYKVWYVQEVEKDVE